MEPNEALERCKAYENNSRSESGSTYIIGECLTIGNHDSIISVA